MNNNQNGQQVAFEAIEQNRIFVKWNKNNSRPRLASVLDAVNKFVSFEVSRKHTEKCMSLLTDVEVKQWDNETFGLGLSLKDFFTKIGKSEIYPSKIEFQTEMKTIKNNFDDVSAKAKKGFKKRLMELNEQREIEVVFLEVYSTYETDESNLWSDLLK